MKTKKLFGILIAAMGLLFVNNVMAIEHGSIIGKNVQLYTQVSGQPVNTDFPIAGVTVDYKLVTMGGKAWAYMKMTGATLFAQDWASQFRCWGAGFTGIMQENNLTNRMTGNISYGTNSKTLPAETTFPLSFYQAIGNTTFYETVRVPYDQTAPNSKDPLDTSAPRFTSAFSHTLDNLVFKINLAATDNSGSYFYYIEEANTGTKEVLFSDGTFQRTLAPETAYDYKVSVIDFSGNESQPEEIQFTTGQAPTLPPDSHSEYCMYVMGNSADQYAYMTMETDAYGRFTMTIAPYDGDANTYFRGDGYTDVRVAAITVNGDPNTGNKYFTRAINAAKTQITFTPKPGMMYPGDKISTNQSIEYQTSKNNNLFPALKFDYTYGTNCSDVPVISTSISTLRFNLNKPVETFSLSAKNLTNDIMLEVPRGLEVSPTVISPDASGNITDAQVTVTWKEGSSTGAALRIYGTDLVNDVKLLVSATGFSDYCNAVISQSNNGTNPAYMTVSLSDDRQQLYFDINPVPGQLATWNNNSIPAANILLNGYAPETAVVRTLTNSRITLDFGEALLDNATVTFGNPITWTLKKEEDGSTISANVYINPVKVYTVGLGCELAPGAGIEKISAKQLFSIAQGTDMIQILAKKAIASTQLYTIGGQLVINSATDIINTSILGKGIYILKVKDVDGNIGAFKIAVR